MEPGVVLLTGGNSGIGFEAASGLTRAGWRVVIASRNRAASAEAVRALAKEVVSRGFPLRALVCNAGLQVSRGLQRTADGYELTFAANHLGHFLLVNLLLDRLASPARIVIVSSGVHDPARFTGMPKATVGDFDVLAATGEPDPDLFDGRLACVNSKLCNVWFAD